MPASAKAIELKAKVDTTIKPAINSLTMIFNEYSPDMPLIFYCAKVSGNKGSNLMQSIFTQTVKQKVVRPKIALSVKPCISDIMITTQFRHIKLWFAGKLRNWELAAYEVERIKASLANAAGFI